MIIEVSFVIAGGVNFGLERSWRVIEGILTKYPHATWRKIMGLKRGKYIVEIH